MSEDDPDFTEAHDADRLLAAIVLLQRSTQVLAAEQKLCLHCLASDVAMTLLMNVASDMVKVGRPDEALKMRQRIWDGITTELPRVN